MRPRHLATGMAMAVLTLAGCTDLPGSARSGADVSRAAPALTAEDAATSAVIESLLERRSALTEASPYETVASAVLDANARTAEAELRAARLRSVAASRNWIPNIGPQITLTSLGDVVTNMLVEQVIYNAGRLKAERAFAAADVDVAAVALAEDSNTRVGTALDLYIAAERARAGAARGVEALERMRRFEHVMQRRVDGGVSSTADLALVRQKRDELQSDLTEDREAERTALGELNAMAARPLDSVRGLGGIGKSASSASATNSLPVLRAEAEATRAVEQAKISRAGFLPGLSATGTAGENGTDGVGLTANIAQGLGAGTPAQLEAINAVAEAAQRDVQQAREDSARRIARLASRRDALADQLARTNRLTDEALGIYRAYERQYDAGFRTVMDVVGTFETWIRLDREATGLRHDLARAEIGLARELGLLVDGARM